MIPDVLVVGAGPVGLTMAAELARYGVSVRIIDKGQTRTDKSKALVLWSRSLELIDRMGCGGSFVRAGHKVTAVNIVAGARRIGHVRLDGVATPHPYALMLPQSETEQLMEEQLRRIGVQVEREAELLRFAAGPDGVNAVLRYSTGREESIDTAWLIGCDGAHSAVRHGLGIGFEGDTLPSTWVLADVHLAGDRRKSDELDIFWHADGVLALFPITPGRYRVIANVGHGDGGEPAEPTLAEVQALLDRRGPGGITASAPVWLAPFRINERKVANYRAGRVFLAGDAAHIHSPAGGQGMNTGMQDACNLAWKLALVRHGACAPEPLLGSYSTERSAVGRKVLAAAGRMTFAALLRGRMAQAIRNNAASAMLNLPPVRRAIARSLTELAISYPDSPLTRRGRSVRGGPAAGERAPVGDGANPVGAGAAPRFALFAEEPATGVGLFNRYRDLLEPQTRPAFSPDGIWLVRPDGYVALATKRGNWAEVEAYLARIAGMRGTSA